ncbi:hypothetical protein C8J46_105306 [Sphingomonas sp. PP-F2F-A104-K0414]|uniref:hypothetical protein n=1 Tax=Sphingomonas sp. PP-F2F-A104-K0414 TaxID=2135661 RepID=UPI0010E11AA3|nr:hypothetical protein [Sphingomonas sp. PP-F2F-A104-K0414]TCP98153.1 hypothetical protein C8J46_105306 [Sphingomonas sp. PP-F2F-A104-K0414]
MVRVEPATLLWRDANGLGQLDADRDVGALGVEQFGLERERLRVRALKQIGLLLGYATGDIDENDTDELRDALKNSKGPGNFKNLFVHAPGGKEGSIKILPIAEVGAKDEFLGIKNATRDDVLAAHRTPPSVLGIVPAQGSQLGKISEAVDMFFELEILPLQMAFLEINDRVGFEAVRFTPRAIAPVK